MTPELDAERSRSQNHRRMGRARRLLVLAALAPACQDSDRATTYGDLELEVRSVDKDFAATFADTATIVATVAYGSCIDEFYRDHDEDTFAGADGKDAVSEWQASLCDPETFDDDEPPIACEVVELEQRLAGGLTGLVATFSVTGEIADRFLRLGPFPDEDSADCKGGALPGLYVGADALVGRDADDVAIWTARPIEDSVAVVDQSAPVLVYATRLAPP